jgi:alpha-L-rhamnosidase
MTQSTPPLILKKSSWIWPTYPSWDLYNCYALFRRTFELEQTPRKAPLYITADQSYHLYINGEYVCRGPARGFQSHWPYDEVDVAKHLRRGKNVMAVRAYNPGCGTFQYISQGVAGLLVAAKWGRFELLSGRGWKGLRQEGVVRDTVVATIQLFPQEYVDKNAQPDDWMMPDFDDSAWPSHMEARVFGAMPWHTLEPRMIPMLEERPVLPQKLLGLGAGPSAAGYRDTRNIVAVRMKEELSHAPVPGDVSLTPLRTEPSGAGFFKSYLLDFGRTVLGSLSITVSGAQGGEIIDLVHSEAIDPQKLSPCLLPGTFESLGLRLICRPGRNTHDFYHPYGFRYLAVTVRDAEAPLEINCHLNWIGYPLERKGSFKSSDLVLERIWDISAWTQQCCAIDAYVDTPWREQAQWWGDARVQAWNTFHMNGDPRLLRRGIHCIASQTTPNGLTYGHSPTIAHGCILPDFTLIWMLTLWDYYWQTGSVEPFKTHRKEIEGALDYFKEQTHPKIGLVGYDPRYWLFLDWTDIFKNGYPTLYNLWLLLTLQALAKLHRVNKDASSAKGVEAWAGHLRKALKKLINPEGLVRDGFTFDGKPVETASIHSQVLAILSGLNPASERAMIGKSLLPFIRGESNDKCQPSSYWCTYLFTVLAECGYGSEVIEFIRRKWEPMIAHGTTFERFESGMGKGSLSHAWSAHPLYHTMQIIGGITQTAPAWKRIRFKPCFLGECGGATVPSPQGPIIGAWEKKGDKVDVALLLPRGVSARVELPGIKPLQVTGRKHWTVQAAAGN